MTIGSFKLPNPNAVLYKDMKQQTKKGRLLSSVFVTSLMLVILAIFVLFAMTMDSIDGGSSVDYQTFSILFNVLAFIEFGLVCLITPALTASAITSEHEKQTFDVLVITNLSPIQIIRGKFWASILQILLVIVSGFPVFSLVFVYGGVNIIHAFAVMIILMVSAAFFAAIGIFCSSVTKKTITATVLTFILVFAALLGTISVTASTISIIQIFSELIFDSTGSYPFVQGDLAYFILYFNPLTTLFDALSYMGLDIFGTDYNGMAGIIGSISKRITHQNIFVRYWSIISIAVQIYATHLFLKLAAKNIDPLRKRKVKKNGKKQRK